MYDSSAFLSALASNSNVASSFLPRTSSEELRNFSSAVRISTGKLIQLVTFNNKKKMIRFFLLQNRQGKTRLSKWYVPPPIGGGAGSGGGASSLVSSANGSGGGGYSAAADGSNQTEAEKARIEAEVHRLVTSRDKKYTNFIEYNNYKLIYRRYAGLFFTIAVDVQDNELSYLESIHLFVELLDSYFANVCELDIVFNFNKVYLILDEYMLAGEIEETSKREILDRVKFLEKLD